ncbi:MAG: ribose 5-phosphate isomerase A [Thermoprotei archaeon]|nr:MAG: ribose 5-phosphate isomerase A [Thermoprotei archaeon]
MSVDLAKLNAAKAAAKLVGDSRVIGVGSGTTVEKFIEIISHDESFKQGVYVPSSLDTALKLSQAGFRVLHPSAVSRVEVYVDGADEVDPSLNMIKGGGAAMTLEKVLAFYAERRIFIVDYTKLVDRLGLRHPVPVEVLPHAMSMVLSELRRRGYRAEPRLAGRGKVGPLVSDVGGVVVDVRVGPIDDPKSLDKELRSLPGIVETGLFIGLADMVIVGYPDRYDVLRLR